YETGRKNEEETLAMLEKRKRYFDKVIVISNMPTFSKIKSEGIETLNPNEFFEKEPSNYF
ncbi:MAG: hypothetical protein RXP92_03825, partial [Candidatus Micrarchaeota archaeon]